MIGRPKVRGTHLSSKRPVRARRVVGADIDVSVDPRRVDLLMIGTGVLTVLGIAWAVVGWTVIA